LLRELHAQNPDNDTVRFELSESLADMSVFDDRISREGLTQDIARLREALKHFEALASTNPNAPKYTNAVVHTHFKLGVLLERLAQHSPQGPDRELEQEAGISFRKAAEGYAILLRRTPDAVGYRAWHALFLQHQGGNALKSGLFDQAEQALQQSIATWQQLIQTHPGESISWYALPVAYDLLSHAQRRMDKHFEADESMQQAEMSRLYRDMER
jgi:tetratricopeptide (TPR) repeat protein